MPCSQCGKPAVAKAGDAPLCVDCFYKLQVAATLQVRMQVMHMNHAADQMDWATGLRNFTPKMQVPDLPQAPLILHNIKIDNSVVGSVNTGTVQTIDVAITYLEDSGNTQISHALTNITQEIANNTEISDTLKKELLEQLAYVGEQATAAAKDRKPGMIKAALSAITQGATTVSAISSAWAAVKPLLQGHFGISLP